MVDIFEVPSKIESQPIQNTPFNISEILSTPIKNPHKSQEESWPILKPEIRD